MEAEARETRVMSYTEKTLAQKSGEGKVIEVPHFRIDVFCISLDLWPH